jgi:endonuclease/exonuclease/phosphatase family metal-dependent hydrolase
MRRTALALAGVVLGLAGFQPAGAATTPSQVGLVSFVASSVSGTSASMTIDWPDARYATKYQVFVSRSYSMSNATRRSSTGSRMTLTNLHAGYSYFVQVRGINGSAVGKKSQRSGHIAILRQGTATGPTYRIMSYNVCSRVCEEERDYRYYRWSQRKPKAIARVTAYRPDVIAFQEAEKDRLTAADLDGYALAEQSHAKQLYYKSSRFDVADAGEISMGNSRYAVWAELADRTTSNVPEQRKHVIFVSVHTTPGKSDAVALDRKAEVTRLLAGIAAIQPTSGKLPVIYAGDFNSHKNRSNDYVAAVFHKAGYYDSFDLARLLTRQHHNSYNAFQTTPVISVKWGDHVDHVWTTPGRTRVLRWRNGVLISSGRLVAPIPSDHSPLVVEVQVN